MSASLRFAAGTFRCSAQPGSRSNSPAAQTIAGPVPSGLPLLSAFTRVLQSGGDSDSGPGSCCAAATNSIAACARTTWAISRKHLRKRRATWFLGSDRNFAAKHPQGATKARRIWALTPKMPESESELIPQTPCGRAEQRRLGRIKILDVRRPRSGLVP